MVPFKSLGAVSYSLSIVTMAASVAVCEILSVKERCDLENRVRVSYLLKYNRLFSEAPTAYRGKCVMFRVISIAVI